MSWLVFSLICLFIYGVWGFLSKFLTMGLNAPNMLIYSLLGSALGIPLYIIAYRQSFSLPWENHWTYLAMLVGVFTSLGAFFFFNAIALGEASKVVVITSLYPLVTAILALIFLKEPLTLSKLLGIFLCLAGIVILSYSQ
ncbi:MAG: EamA family transporter [Cyanobacteria bacterium SW_9_44_58]|nr:MAG: EamA family transporter [Cyanobacteria bacterium SW_9_44_58]